MKQQICIFTGARPNFVKVAPLIRAIDNCKTCDYSLVYAGREDDPTLEASLYSDLQMPRPDEFLNVDCENLNELTGLVMARFEHYLDGHPADTVVVVDDLASTMAAAIVAKKRGIRLAHLVAGTRSFDINMPKEVNRLVIDGLSDMLFTAGMGSTSIAAREGAESHRIFMVGNILTDQLRFCCNRWRQPECAPEGDYLVLTLNRRALMEDSDNLTRMLDAVVEGSGGMPVIAPLRGQAADAVTRHGGLQVVDPLPYLEFGWLTSHARGIITDSGNVAEEATFNRVPCITLNSYTEHIETVRMGTNVLAGEDAGRLRQLMAELTAGRWKPSALPDRWDGRTAERIVMMLTK